MGIRILGPFNDIINKTTAEIVDSQITTKVVGVLTALITSSVEVVDDTLKSIRDVTKKEEPQP